jgi:hypothetical protein
MSDHYLDLYLSGPSSGHASPIVACNATFPYGKATSSRDCGWAVNQGLSSVDLRWSDSLFGTVGDHFGLFPINYLTRFLRGSQQKTVSVDLRVAVLAAENYVLPYPHRLDLNHSHFPNELPATFPFSRGGQLPGEVPPPAGSPPVYDMIWADDQYMGLTLLARLVSMPHTYIFWIRERECC